MYQVKTRNVSWLDRPFFSAVGGAFLYLLSGCATPKQATMLVRLGNSMYKAQFSDEDKNNVFERLQLYRLSADVAANLPEEDLRHDRVQIIYENWLEKRIKELTGLEVKIVPVELSAQDKGEELPREGAAP